MRNDKTKPRWLPNELDIADRRWGFGEAVGHPYYDWVLPSVRIRFKIDGGAASRQGSWQRSRY